MSNNITSNPETPSQIVANCKFPTFMHGLGIIPTSYKDSMDYYENLVWLCKFLEETVIPTVNQNGEAVQELQGLYNELNSYVSNYFDNLDVQEEINNKLDELVTNGTIQQLINNRFNFLNDEIRSVASGSPAGVYPTISALQQADPDHSKIYIVTDDGNWYFFNTATNQWKNGGLYLSSEDYESVKNDIIEIRDNIENYIEISFDPLKLGNGYYDHNSGNVINNSNTQYFKPIEIKKSIKLNFKCYAYFSGYKDNGGVWHALSNNANQTVGSIVIPENSLLYISMGNTTENPVLYTSNNYFSYINEKWLSLPKQNNGYIDIPTQIEGNGYYNHDTGASVNNNVLEHIIPLYFEFATSLNIKNIYPFFSGYKDNNGVWHALSNIDGNRDVTISIPNKSTLYLTHTINYKPIELFCGNKENFEYFVGYPEKENNFNKLSEAINEAVKYKNSTVYINSITIDIFDDLGSEFFNVTGTIQNFGIKLYNGIKLKFASGSKINAIYTGNNATVLRDFSVFNALHNGVEDGFTIENCNIEAKNIRYCVHDERIEREDSYKHIYKNCIFSIDNSQNSQFTSESCIGSGLGQHGEIIVENCIFKRGDYGVHNSSNINAQSNIVVKNCYFANNYTVAYQPYGSSTKETSLIVTNCKLGRDIRKIGTLNNMTLYAWNNQ